MPAYGHGIRFNACRSMLEYEGDSRPLPGAAPLWLRWSSKFTIPPRGFGLLGDTHLAIIGFHRDAQVIAISDIVAIEMHARCKARCGVNCELRLHHKDRQGHVFTPA